MKKFIFILTALLSTQAFAAGEGIVVHRARADMDGNGLQDKIQMVYKRTYPTDERTVINGIHQCDRIVVEVELAYATADGIVGKTKEILNIPNKYREVLTMGIEDFETNGILDIYVWEQIHGFDYFEGDSSMTNRELSQYFPAETFSITLLNNGKGSFEAVQDGPPFPIHGDETFALYKKLKFNGVIQHFITYDPDYTYPPVVKK